jgi:GntR family transcriptional regulator of vanillate catabolism
MARAEETSGQVVDHESAPASVRAQLRLRELILAGELAAGERISEQSVVDRIGASRTPVRTALLRLEDEGFLEQIPSGGYAVRSFTEADIFDAIEVRGTMEGLGARLAAERGLSPRDLGPIEAIAAQIDGVLAETDSMDEEHFARYAELNGRFHDAVRDLSGSQVVARQIDRANAYPFASHSGLVMAQSALPEARTVLTVGQYQHRALLDALASGQGERAESIAREHARLAAQNLTYLLRNGDSRRMVPGEALIATIRR